MRERRGATALAMALLLVPLLLTAGVAVDLSRIASVRTLLQASVDGAAVAGVNEWRMSQSSTNAYTVAYNDFSNTGAQLSNFAAPVTPVVNLACTGVAAQCGGTHSFSATSAYGCPDTTAFEYCIVVTATLTLKNSLLGNLIPARLLSVTGGAASTYANSSFTGKNIPPSPGFGSAGDWSDITAYAVPMTGTSSDYNTVPTPNSYCSSFPGPLQYIPESAPTNGATQCNYLYIADSRGNTGTGGAITLAQGQAIGFLFTNDSGASGFNRIDSTQYTTHLMVSTTSSSNGYQ